MGKKTKEEAFITRQKIIKSARELYYKKGFSNTTINDIAVNAGLTRGAFYWHFNSKVEIFYALYDEIIEKLEDIFSQSIGKKDADLNAIYDFMHLTINNLINNENFRKTVDLLRYKTELTKELEVINEKDIFWINRLVDKMAFLIEEYKKKNDIKLFLESKDIAVSIVAMYRGLAQMCIFNNEIFSYDNSHIKIIDSFLNNLLKGE